MISTTQNSSSHIPASCLPLNSSFYIMFITMSHSYLSCRWTVFVVGLILLTSIPTLASSLLQDCTHTTYIPDPIRSANMVTSTAYTTTQCTTQYWDCKGCNQVAVIPYGHIWVLGEDGGINHNMVRYSRTLTNTECATMPLQVLHNLTSYSTLEAEPESLVMRTE